MELNRKQFSESSDSNHDCGVLAPDPAAPSTSQYHRGLCSSKLQERSLKSIWVRDITWHGRSNSTRTACCAASSCGRDQREGEMLPKLDVFLGLVPYLPFYLNAKSSQKMVADVCLSSLRLLFMSLPSMPPTNSQLCVRGLQLLWLVMNLTWSCGTPLRIVSWHLPSQAFEEFNRVTSVD